MVCQEGMATRVPWQPSWPLPELPPPRPKQPPPDKRQAVLLRDTARELGALIQYSCQGFLPNKRQQLMAGFAVIEAAQALRRQVLPLLSSSCSVFDCNSRPWSTCDDRDKAVGRAGVADV